MFEVFKKATFNLPGGVWAGIYSFAYVGMTLGEYVQSGYKVPAHWTANLIAVLGIYGATTTVQKISGVRGPAPPAVPQPPQEIQNGVSG